ncbi:hypothetical protein G3576_29655 [Roseomonas stagni]|uniref:Alpha-L-glutamate ligase-related protein ATP-grasp domain-containing protein n=1 Tax=Falsiroseomonas algicola TaxID=2716930 RepID=A0A6M1LW37_9PROT|nr:sugar-transfer associated ATP-grasp domain-containing protein [Falsiroseomonas algicola]NGM24192.1 hypothetical protein [Falsiroseomonas algicola]
MTGARPMEAHVWRDVAGGRHPLPARAAALLLPRLGDSAAHALLADKLATADHLAATGIPFPALHGMLRRGETPDLPALARHAAQGALFLKPRHGHGGRGAFTLAWQAGEWLLDGRVLAPAALAARLEQLTRRDDMLVQERLMAPAALADWVVAGRAPVLRLATARHPGGMPFLHGALLTLAVPGRSPHHFLDGAIHAALDPATGLLAPGRSLAAPRRRTTRLPWNGARLEGLPVPAFPDAVAVALRAMTALPPVPLIHWDMIVTDAGPVLLEGNSAGNWILASLPGLDGLDAGPLAPLLTAWAAVGAAAAGLLDAPRHHR